MATTYRNNSLQGTAGLTTYGTLYNTSASTTAVVSTILLCNTSATQQQYRIGIMGSAGTPSTQDFIVFNDSVAGNDTVALTLGVTLGNSQFIRVSSSSNSLGFHAFVSEIS
jgi:hypothetical protein